MAPKLSRRRFISSSILLPVAASAGLAPLPAKAYAPPGRTGGSYLPSSLNAYSFIELLNANAKDPSKGIDLFQLCDFCAEQGFAAIDPTGYFFPGYPGVPADDYIFKLKRHAFNLGLEFSGTGVRNDFITAEVAERKRGIERVKAWTEVAAKLGAPVIRVFADSQPPYGSWEEAAAGARREEVETWLCEAISECVDHAEKFGVYIGVQNHGDFIKSGKEHLRLLERVNRDWCAAIVDTGKYLTEDPYEDIKLMAPYACNWQIKETTGSSLDSPTTDMRKLVGIIRDSGYRGYIPIETLAMKRPGYDSFVAVPAMLAELNQALEETAAKQ